MNERAIFIEALEKDTPAGRSAYLDEACGGDAVLRRRVEALLTSHDQAGGFLEKPVPQRLAEKRATPPEETPGGPPEGDRQSLAPGPIATIDEPRLTARPGTVIGPYKLLQQIGEGGMGTVFMAEQTHPVQRKVALKVIKPGMDSAQVIARFEAERQALVVMDHVNIARVLDAGATQSGLPYFVMELIHGVPITRYCDDNQLTPRQRLELFVPVCRAIQHAHQKGIIHRDLKPSNVLITLYDGKPVPKVIDFGIAKATEQRLTERPLFTQYGTLVGTLEYMSPEQAEMSALGVDTRSDIYSLGVLLYELLTGSTPLSHKRVREAAYVEVLRMIKEEEPPRPSTRLSDSGEALASISAQRHMEPAKLAKLVRGELDWIVMKCLEKDRSRRYETANGFAADVQRYLNDEPVLACPPSAGYRVRKLMRRHKGPVLAAALMLLALVVGVIGLGWGLVQAERQRALALREGEAATQARNQAEANLRLARANFSLAQKAVEDTATKIAQNPRLREADFHALRRDLLASLVPFHEQFVKQQSDDPELEAERGRAYWRLAIVRHEMGEEAQALADYERMRSIFQQLAARYPEVPSYRSQLATSHDQVGAQLSRLERLQEAEEAFRAAIQLGERLADEFPTEPSYRHEMVARYNNLGTVLKSTGRLAQAEAALRKALAIQEQLSAGRPVAAELSEHLAASYHNLGALLDSVHKVKEAEAAFRASLKIRARLAAAFPTDPACRERLASSYKSLGIVLRDAGRMQAAEAACRNALKIREELAAAFPAVPEYRRQLAGSQNSLGVLLFASHEHAKAATAYSDAIAILEKLGADFPGVPGYAFDLGGSYCNLGKLLYAKGQPQAALDWYDKAIRTLAPVLAREKRLAAARSYLSITHRARASALTRLRQYADSFKDWDRALELAERADRQDIRILRAVAWAHAGETAKAVVEADDLTAGPGVPDHLLYDAACIHGLAAAKAEGEPAAAHAAKAVALLRRVQAAGFFRQAHRVEHVKKDPDLHALHDDASFRKFVAELEKAGLLKEGAK